MDIAVTSPEQGPTQCRTDWFVCGANIVTIFEFSELNLVGFDNLYLNM